MKILDQLAVWWRTPDHDSLIEGPYADQYHPQTQDQIRADYLRRWHPEHRPVTPLTAPHLFDPCEPPAGWRYDPYYECWITHD
jgi:hypothetical protein